MTKKCCPQSLTLTPLESSTSAHFARADHRHGAARRNRAEDDRLIGPNDFARCNGATQRRTSMPIGEVAICNGGSFPAFPIAWEVAASRASFNQGSSSIDFTQHWTISSCACEHRAHCTFSVPMIELVPRVDCDRILFVRWLRGKMPRGPCACPPTPRVHSFSRCSTRAPSATAPFSSHRRLDERSPLG